MGESLFFCIFSILAVFVVFCIVLFLTKTYIKKPPVIICTFNNENTIEAKIRIAMVKNPESDIIVVDLGSTDDTEKIVRIMMYKYKKIFFEQRNFKKVID